MQGKICAAKMIVCWLSILKLQRDSRGGIPLVISSRYFSKTILGSSCSCSQEYQDREGRDLMVYATMADIVLASEAPSDGKHTLAK